MTRSRKELELSDGWRATRHEPSDSNARWIPVAKVPTVIHLDLMALPDGHPDKIADPFLDLNELDCQWVADACWTYECRFRTPGLSTHGTGSQSHEDEHKAHNQSTTQGRVGEEAEHRKLPIRDGLTEDTQQKGRHSGQDGQRLSELFSTTNLVFKGLDTIATVTLNGRQILKADNMFMEYVVDVTDHLSSDPRNDNVLLIRFDSARQAGLDRVQNGPRHEYHVHQTEIGRAAVRKAQYHWGWDWGPILTTAGPWKSVILETYDSRISAARIWTSLEDNLARGKLVVDVDTTGADAAEITVTVYQPDLPFLFQTAQIANGSQRTTLTFDVSEPQLWWPMGYGWQKLYEVEIKLYDKARRQADSMKKTCGFRRVELVQQPDKLGRSFYFRINNTDIFAGGSCWVPAHSFLPALRDNDYDRWAELMIESYQIMVRVWGGGVYEADAFYDACDRNGILVWQDFAFACASYPANDPAFLESVATEARQNAARLQGHPSLVLWAGNNEDYQIKEHYDLQYDPASTDPQAWLQRTKFPARYIYEKLLPEIVAEAYGVGRGGGPAVPYQPGSPYGDARSTTLKADPSIGDIHQWNVWHGSMRPYQEYPVLGGRFVSEFGMAGYPHVDTLARNITNKDEQFWPGSTAMEFRNKAVGHQHRLLKYVHENFRIHRLDDLASFAHLTQVMQADAVSHAYKGWRRLWGDEKQQGRGCGGVLVWQLNDCWPTVSWSVVDFYGVPKPAYYAIARALDPTAIGVSRPFRDWTMRRANASSGGGTWQRDTGHLEPNKHSVSSSPIRYDVWVASTLLDPQPRHDILIRCISIATGRDAQPPVRIARYIAANATTEIGRGWEFAPDPAADGPCVVYAALLVRGNVVHWDAAWPDPIKYLEFPDRNVQVDATKLDPAKTTGTVTVSADKPVKGFVFAEEKDGVRFGDNGFDVMPGDPQEVGLTRSSADGAWPALEYTWVGRDIWG